MGCVGEPEPEPEICFSQYVGSPFAHFDRFPFMLLLVSSYFFVSSFSFSKSRPSWSAHRGAPTHRGVPISRGAHLFKKRGKMKEKKVKRVIRPLRKKRKTFLNMFKNVPINFHQNLKEKSHFK